jgi:hypothetical protein
LYQSADYGKSWKSVKGNLPESVANVIIQDPINPDLLYCGLDNGSFVSVDRGTNWHLFNKMLNVPSYDMMVHPRDNELVVGTHGRSVFVADVKPLQALKKGVVDKGVIAFAPENIRHSDRWGQKQYPWADVNEPEAEFFYYVGKPSQNLSAEIYDEKNLLVRKLTLNGSPGFHVAKWDVKIDEVQPTNKKQKSTVVEGSGSQSKYAGKGKYKAKFVSASDTSEVTMEIK